MFQSVVVVAGRLERGLATVCGRAVAIEPAERANRLLMGAPPAQAGRCVVRAAASPTGHLIELGFAAAEEAVACDQREREEWNPSTTRHIDSLSRGVVALWGPPCRWSLWRRAWSPSAPRGTVEHPPGDEAGDNHGQHQCTVGDGPGQASRHHAELGHAADAGDEVEGRKTTLMNVSFLSSTFTLLMLLLGASIRPESTTLVTSVWSRHWWFSIMMSSSSLLRVVELGLDLGAWLIQPAPRKVVGGESGGNGSYEGGSLARSAAG
jgi:hypothetical protein